VDLERGTLRVVASLARVDRRLVSTAPKSGKSRRTIRLSPTAVETLRRQRREQNERRLIGGPGWNDGGFVFDRGDRQALDPAETSNVFQRAAKKAGVPGLRLHGLRHAYATTLLAANVHPKIVSEQLGHANIGITLDTYCHVLPSMGEVAAEAIERAFGAVKPGG
jgi:integrase